MLEKFIGDTENIPEHPFPSYEHRGAFSVALGFSVVVGFIAVNVYVLYL